MATNQLAQLNPVGFAADVNTILHGRDAKVRNAIHDYLSQIEGSFSETVISVTLYGSQARGDARPSSDIDLFVVVRTDDSALWDALHDLAWRIQYQYDVIISDVIRSQAQAIQMQRKQFPYYRSIMRDGVLLWKSAFERTPDFA